MGRAGSPGDAWRPLQDILALVSHDLRSPLSAVSVGIEALSDPGLDQTTRERYLSAMRRAVVRADRFLTDLTDVGRVAAGTLKLETADILIEPLLERAARDHDADARAAGTWIVVESDEHIHPVTGDADRLLQALDKLLTNAMRHARGSGEIMLRAENGHALERDTVRLWVIDHGPGVPEREMEGIFDRCLTGQRVRGRRAGLGLPLVKGIAEAHGGSIHVEGTPGSGASFCIELPAAS
jgi:signal transduction histidine kinase